MTENPSDDGWPPACPRCKSKAVNYQEKQEYTGGGYADTWTEHACDDCGWEWQSEKKSGYA